MRPHNIQIVILVLVELDGEGGLVVEADEVVVVGDVADVVVVETCRIRQVLVLQLALVHVIDRPKVFEVLVDQSIQIILGILLILRDHLRRNQLQLLSDQP